MRITDSTSGEGGSNMEFVYQAIVWAVIIGAVVVFVYTAWHVGIWFDWKYRWRPKVVTAIREQTEPLHKKITRLDKRVKKLEKLEGRIHELERKK